MSMQEDELRRRQGPAAGGGIGGPTMAPGMMMPYMQGTPTYDFSGIQGKGGLAAFLESRAQNPGRGFGPAGRHLRNVGQPVEFPGTDSQLGPGAGIGPPGGFNAAPGSPNGLAIGQTGALPPGLQKQLGGTQGWRNLAPGHAVAAAAGYGTEAFPSPTTQARPMPRGVPQTGAAEAPNVGARKRRAGGAGRRLGMRNRGAAGPGGGGGKTTTRRA